MVDICRHMINGILSTSRSNPGYMYELQVYEASRCILRILQVAKKVLVENDFTNLTLSIMCERNFEHKGIGFLDFSTKKARLKDSLGSQIMDSAYKTERIIEV